MKQESRNLVKYRLKRARETLLDAQKYFKDATLNSTVNRIYYAMFYAVNGLLISKGLSSSNHSGVRALFNKEFINKGTVEKNWGKFYSEMFNNRQEGDYIETVLLYTPSSLHTTFTGIKKSPKSDVPS